MKDESKTKAQLITELSELRQQNAAMAAASASRPEPEKAAQGNEHFRLLTENSPYVIYRYEFLPQRRCVYISPAIQALTGYIPEDYYADPELCLKLIHADDRPLFEALLRAPTKPNKRLVLRWVHRDGQVAWTEHHTISFTDEKDQVVAVEGIAHDITPFKKAEDALRKSEQRLELVLQGADLGLWDIHIPTGTDFTNDRAVEMLGYTLAEAEPHMGWWDRLTHPDDLPGVVQKWKAHLAGQTPLYECEYRLRTKSNEWVWILDRGKVVEWDRAGKPVRATGTHLDITERKQSEEALQHLNRELALLNNASQAFNSSLDLDVVLVSFLEEVRPLLGVIGASVWLIDAETGELVCRQASGAHRASLRGWHLPLGEGIVGWVARNDQSQNVAEVQADPRHFKPIEQLLNLELHSILAVPLRSKEAVIGVLEVVDIEANRFSQSDVLLVESLAATAAIAIENAHLYEQTRRDAETKAVLLQEVNHRTKNNLAAIIGLLHLEQRHMSDEARTIYHTIMQDLISRIHGLATVHRLLSAADWSPILLSELVTKVVHSALQALPLDKSVSVEVYPASIQVAPKLTNSLALLINELTTNTIKYAWPTTESGRIMVHMENMGNEILLEFRDDGPGYPEEVLRLEQYNVGWELIQTLVQQGLQGHVTLRNDNGAVTTIRFPQLA